MKHHLICLTLILFLFILLISCQPSSEQQQAGKEIEQKTEGNEAQKIKQEVTFPPTQITTYASPSNPALNQPFLLEIRADNQRGIKAIAWTSSKPFANGKQQDTFACNLQTTCYNTWELTTGKEGLHEIKISVISQESILMAESSLKIEVQEQRETTPAEQGEEVPAKDSNATETAPVEEPTVEEPECNSDYDCGSKAICSEGACYSVDCKTDADCSGCRRCSYNSCVKCAQGPYGCSC
ncbi:hypothetical protein HYX12_00510 [Candidatus Woesearchaeota archaeon]|nr:hypothetical protein [Candidatus Woesearchaeota archaeon]